MPTKKTATKTKRSVKKIAPAPEMILPPLLFSAAPAKSKKANGKKKEVRRKEGKKSGKKPEVIVVEEVTLGKKQSLKLPSAVSKEYLVVHRCTNCEHIPFSVTKLVTLFSVLIMLLSVSVLIQVGTIDVSKLVAFVAPVVHAASSFSIR